MGRRVNSPNITRMYSTPAVGPEVQNTRRSLGREPARSRFSGRGGIRTRETSRSFAMYSTPAVECCFKRTNEVGESETYGALPLSYGATDVLVAPMGFEPTISGLEGMYSNSAVGPIFKATRWWPEAP